jgi:hypothetical protein
MDVTNLYDRTGGWVGGWVAGWVVGQVGGWVTIWKIMPLCGPILQAESCQTFSAELRFQDRAEIRTVLAEIFYIKFC